MSAAVDLHRSSWLGLRGSAWSRWSPTLVRARCGRLWVARLIVCLVACLAAMAVAVVGAAPASAHGSPDATAVPSVNYRTELTGPAWPDIHVQMVDNSDRVEIRNDSPLDVIVLGYDGEPYLRIGQQGAFENLQSPATYLNRTVSGNAPIPSGLDPDGPPSWRRLSSAPVARFHDHRTHWMANTLPDDVLADPNSSHVIIEDISIELTWGDRTGTTTGRTIWSPPPSPMPWLALAGAALASGLAVGWWRRRLAGAVVVAATVAAVSATVWQARAAAGSFVADLANIGWLELVMCAAAIGAVTVDRAPAGGVRLAPNHGAATAARVEPTRGWVRPLLVVCGLGAALLGGLAHASVWSRSYPGFAEPWIVGRAAAACALGWGAAAALCLVIAHRPTKTYGGASPGTPTALQQARESGSTPGS